jgi:DNA-binding LytR/AlgR family response regulator
MSLLSLSKIQEMLPEQQFARIHRSYIININRVDVIEGNMVKV